MTFPKGITRKLPIGIQSFESLRQDGYLYVDKTQNIWNLVESGKVYFLSRPRRFGKSLLISTLEAYFSGRKELFRGLAIEDLENSRGDKAWQTYPVLRFSLSGGEYNEPNGLRKRLSYILDSYVQKFSLTGRYALMGETLPDRFQDLIEKLYLKTGLPVVVLVDEYDKPLLETISRNPAQEELNQQLYKSFFSILKDEDQHIKFVFFTGVTKFSKISIFSDLNQLRDISLSEDAAELCGITEQEMLDTFAPEIEAMAVKLKISIDDCIHQLRKMYDGYHFSPEGKGMYNPFSLLNALQDRDFGRYWYETGTPTMLVEKLKHSDFSPDQLVSGVEVTEMQLRDYRADNPDPIPLFYQSGYLTICGFDREFRLYSLKFPNDEVKYGFLNSLAPSIIGIKDQERPLSLRQLVQDLKAGNVDSFMTRLQSLFAGIPYAEGKSPSYEREWRNQLYLIFTLLGQNVSCEVHSSNGRADCIVETQEYIYIFEFKLDQSADIALQQIDNKDYARPYLSDPRHLLKVGVSFASSNRNIAAWKVEDDK